MARLGGKVALITGGAMGMGAVHAELFVKEGATVVITDRDEKSGQATADKLCGNAVFIKHDVSDYNWWSCVVDQVMKTFGPINILVNNAAISGPRLPTADISVQDYQKIMAVNADSIFFGMRATIPGMMKVGGGSIVNISSVAGFSHSPNTPNLAYTASKFAVRGMTKAAAVEYARHNIRVNSVHPGGVVTPMAEKIFSENDLEAILADAPMGRSGRPIEVSQLVLFLASDEASYITGASVVADGGKLR